MTSNTNIIPSNNLGLSEETMAFVQASKAKNTIRTYESALKDYDAWGGTLPSTPKMVAAYLSDCAKRNKPSAIEVKLAAIRFGHRTKGLPDPTDNELVRATLKGIKRELGTAPLQKAPITRDKLIEMVDAQPATLTGARNRAILLLGFAAAMRRSEIVALDVSSIKFLEGRMVVTLRRSKTDQEGKGFKKNIPYIGGKLCPVTAMMNWLNLSQIEKGPVFRQVDRWGKVRKKRLNGDTVATIVKDAANSIGLDYRDFSGHSLRAGFVTQAYKDRTPEWETQEVTGHKSTDMLRRYNRDEGAGQMDAITKTLGGQNDNE